MNIFKWVYYFFYYLFVKVSYKMIGETDKKEVIYHNRKKGKYVIVVKDNEIGKYLYEVVKSLKSTSITTPCASYKFTQYGLVRKNTVKWFCIEGFFKANWEHLLPFERVIEIQHLVDVLQSKGFVLDDTVFNNEFKSVSEFLSYFTQSNDEDEIKRTKGCMIKYIHHELGYGGELCDFYENLINKVFYPGYNIPYSTPVVRMCYDYFKTGALPDSIMDVLVIGQYAGYPNYSLVLIPDNLDSKFEVTEKTDEYTLYNGCMKIYNNMSSQYYEDFLNEVAILLSQKGASVEQMEAVIVDLDNNIIGYKFVKQDEKKFQTDFNPTSQNEIFEFAVDMVKYLERYGDIHNYDQTRFNDFEIEKSLVWTCGERNNYTFKCRTIKDLFNLTFNNWLSIKEQVTAIFFKLLANYIAKQYGELTSKKQFLEKNEVRFLSPIVANQFVNFALGKAVNYQVATEELFKLFYNRTSSNNGNFSYDSRFYYNPLTVHFSFDYEAEEKYNIMLEKGKTEKLPDGRVLVIFKRSQKISMFVYQENGRRNLINNLIGDVEDEHVKFLEISEMIVGTKRLNSENMYNIIGYVTEPIEGTQLTREALIQLNNRDLLKVAAYLFCKFGDNYIPWKNIWMDSNFKFFINYRDEEFEILRSPNGISYNSDFVQMVFERLLNAGYNPNAFIGWDLPSGYRYKDAQRYLLSLADGLDTYCDEHNIYYNSKNGQCPVCAQTKYLVPQNYVEVFKTVFEDSVAIHYNIDQAYNLKVYKGTYNSELKALVSSWVSLRIKCEDATLGFFQDCFLPSKMALDSNKQFIGYIYEAEKFETTNGDTSDVCVDLADVEMLKNLPRLKSLIRLILQVKEITNRGFGFVTNPFSHVFLNTSHKKQVQILNIDFMIGGCNGRQLRQTQEWTCDYIRKVLELDSTIEYKTTVLERVVTGMDLMLSNLQKLADEMTKYCPVHKMYYKSSYICCPKCIDPKDQPKNILYTHKSDYDVRTPINEGGEAFIYSHSNGTVAKIFKTGEINRDFKNNVLFRILTKKAILEKINMENHKYKYVFPKEILVDNATKEIFGYTMDWVENAFPISTLKDKKEIEKLGFSKKDIFEIIITIGEGIETLHQFANIYIGDLNGRNILFDAQKNVYFLDFDGMGVDEISPEFCTDGYIDPVSKKRQNITAKDDWYSFAVQAFYYLTYTHPFNGIYYEVRYGRDVLLDIPDKMERRISLLGNHGMKAPAIAEPWDWMNADLKNAFLNIFEGDLRESIVPYLKNQYQTLSTNTNEQSFNKFYRINPKFIATELKVFNGNVVKVINSYAAICEDENERYIAILDNDNSQVNIHFSEAQNVKDVLLSEDGKIAFIVYGENEVFVVDLDTSKIIFRESISGATNVVVNDRTMYHTGTSEGKFAIIRMIIYPNGAIQRDPIRLGTKNIKWFNVQFNSKFILITEATQNMDEVYCNSHKFCTFEYSSADIAKQAHYNVIYDKVTKSWLVVNNFGKAIVIHMSSESTRLDISGYVNDVNLKNIYFEKGNIYIPNQECLYIVNVDKSTVKKMECHKIMTPESKVYDVNSSGFSVITQNVFYEVRKG